MKFFYSDVFNLDLPEGHRFPGGKYAMLRRALVAEGVLKAGQLHVSPSVAEADLLRAHDPAYVRRHRRREHRPPPPCGASAFRGRSILRAAPARPWAAPSKQRARRFATGCPANSPAAPTTPTMISAPAIASLTTSPSRPCRCWRKAAQTGSAIVDLDVHQGDGNAAILGPRDDVFVLSVHGEKNFPFRKVASDLDIALPDGAGDEEYLRALDEALPAVWAFRPDIVLYQAGVDPLRRRPARPHGLDPSGPYQARRHGAVSLQAPRRARLHGDRRRLCGAYCGERYGLRQYV